MNAGSNLEFIVSNTSIAAIFLSNSAYQSQTNKNGIDKSVQSSLLLTPSQRTSRQAGPIGISVTLNSKDITYFHTASGLELLAEGLELSSLHHFRVLLPVNDKFSTLQISGIVMNKGGLLLHPSALTGRTLMTHNQSRKSSTRQHPFSISEYSKSRKLIELVATCSMINGVCERSNLKDQNCSSSIPWPRILETHFTGTTLSSLSLSSSICVTRQCQKHPIGTKTTAALVQEVFFRAGAPGTPLYDLIWPVGSSKDSPAALIFMLGLSDIEALLESGPPTKHQMTLFIDEFARTYSNFIQTVRRTAYSPASMACPNIRHPSQMGFQDDIDESYLYNSSPSIIPIFLVLPPIPSPLLHTKAIHLKTLLTHATAKVLSELQWHIGDRNTFIISTDGWLDDTDFQVSSSSSDQIEPTVEFSFTQSGHIKLAHHMSLHLCHYIFDHEASTAECPFDRNDQHVGNLYVPQVASLGQLMEEKKIAKVKEVFGVVP